MSEHIPVFCATDENYAPFASLTMRSVLMHTQSFIDFYIMDGGIKEKTKKQIDEDLKSFPNKSLHFVDMTKYDLNQFPNIASFTTNTFSRYFIPNIAPQIKKAIYLDVDIIVKKDITELYNQDLEDFALAAFPESRFAKTVLIRLKKDIFSSYAGTSYFNAGVLLLDVQKLIAMDFTKKAVDLTAMLYHKLILPDQDVLNIMFENNYKQLDCRFNLMAHAKANINKAGLLSSDPVIIHYTSFKPWKEHCPYEADFEEVLNKSVFKDQVIKKWRAKKKKEFFLFGKYPLLTHIIPKKVF